MRYFQVKPEYDQYPCADFEIGNFIAGELFTKEELVAYNVPLKFVTPVDIPEDKTCWCFGSRKALSEGEQ